MDLRYFAGQSKASAGSLEIPGYRYFVAVWGWPERAVRKLMRDEKSWMDPISLKEQAASTPTPAASSPSQFASHPVAPGVAVSAAASHPPNPSHTSQEPAVNADSVAPPKPAHTAAPAAERRTLVAVSPHFGRSPQRDNAQKSAETSQSGRSSVAVLSDTRDLYSRIHDHEFTDPEKYSPTPHGGESVSDLINRDLVTLVGLRYAQALHRDGIRTVAELRVRTPEEIRFTRGIGQAAARTIVEKLKAIPPDPAQPSQPTELVSIYDNFGDDEEKPCQNARKS